MNRLLVIVAVLLCGSVARASECVGVCVPPDEMDVFVGLLREKKCLQTTKPALTLDPIQITQDKDGRMFVNGTGDHPYRVGMTWCGYEIEASANVRMVVARTPEPTWGFRYRVKVAPGYLPLEALSREDGYAGMDLGLMLEPFFYHSFNLNGYVGVRSVGVNVGLDMTRNMGLHAGYALAFGSLTGGPHVALSFSLW